LNEARYRARHLGGPNSDHAGTAAVDMADHRAFRLCADRGCLSRLKPLLRKAAYLTPPPDRTAPPAHLTSTRQRVIN